MSGRTKTTTEVLGHITWRSRDQSKARGERLHTLSGFRFRQYLKDGKVFCFWWTKHGESVTACGTVAHSKVHVGRSGSILPKRIWIFRVSKNTFGAMCEVEVNCVTALKWYLYTTSVLSHNPLCYISNKRTKLVWLNKSACWISCLWSFRVCGSILSIMSIGHYYEDCHENKMAALFKVHIHVLQFGQISMPKRWLKAL